ncbi:MAG TPA: sigma factor [Candidatus Dormibacteraeota bacterium]|nr:sigma factor [Candidatus Dormibacteraeota bacterium]
MSEGAEGRHDEEEVLARLSPELQRDAHVLAENAAAVARYCRSRTRTLADAEDAVQDTFLRYLRRRDREIRNPQAWLIRAADRACTDIGRNARREVADLQFRPVPRESQNPEDAAVTAWLLTDVIGELRPLDAWLLGRLYLGGWTAAQLARELGLAAGHVRIMAMRARQRARQVLEAKGVAPAGVALGAASRWHGRGRLLFWRLLGRPAAASPAVADRASFSALVLTGLFAAGLLATGPGPATGSAGASQTPPPARTVVGPRSTLRPPGELAHAPTPAVHAHGTAPEAPGRGRSAPSGDLIGAIFSNNDSRADSYQFQHFTASPNYAQDHTIFASGHLVGCLLGCPWYVFQSTDAGRTWNDEGTLGMAPASVTLPVGVVSREGLPLGDLLLPRGYGQDSPVYAVVDSGLVQSVPDPSSGQTSPRFVSSRVDLPGAQHAALFPASPAGHTEFIVDTIPPTYVDADTGRITPGPQTPPGITGVGAMAFTREGKVLVETNIQHQALTKTIFDLCDPFGACETVFTSWLNTEWTILVSPTEAIDHTIVLARQDSLWVSTDDGRTFSAARQLPFSTHAVALDADFAHTQRIFAVPGSALNNLCCVAVSPDAGRSFSLLTPAGLPGQALLDGLEALPDGRLLASLATGGIVCSASDGRSWERSCPR